MSRQAYIALYYATGEIAEVCKSFLRHCYDVKAQILDPSCIFQPNDKTVFLSKNDALARIPLYTHPEREFAIRTEIYYVLLEEIRFRFSCSTNKHLTDVCIDINRPLWHKPHPYCDEYIDWERYSTLIFDTPITAPLVGITTFDTEYY